MVGSDRYTDTWGKSVLGRTGSRYRDPGRSVFGPFEGQKARQRGRNRVKPGRAAREVGRAWSWRALWARKRVWILIWAQRKPLEGL